MCLCWKTRQDRDILALLPACTGWQNRTSLSLLQTNLGRLSLLTFPFNRKEKAKILPPEFYCCCAFFSLLCWKEEHVYAMCALVHGFCHYTKLAALLCSLTCLPEEPMCLHLPIKLTTRTLHLHSQKTLKSPVGEGQCSTALSQHTHLHQPSVLFSATVMELFTHLAGT